MYLPARMDAVTTDGDGAVAGAGSVRADDLQRRVVGRRGVRRLSARPWVSCMRRAAWPYVGLAMLFAVLGFVVLDFRTALIVEFGVGATVTVAQATLYAFAPLCYPADVRNTGVGAAVAAGRLGTVARAAPGGLAAGRGQFRRRGAGGSDPDHAGVGRDGRWRSREPSGRHVCRHRFVGRHRPERRTVDHAGEVGAGWGPTAIPAPTPTESPQLGRRRPLVGGRGFSQEAGASAPASSQSTRPAPSVRHSAARRRRHRARCCDRGRRTSSRESDTDARRPDGDRHCRFRR